MIIITIAQYNEVITKKISNEEMKEMKTNTNEFESDDENLLITTNNVINIDKLKKKRERIRM